jgi:hypothetical protein
MSGSNGIATHIQFVNLGGILFTSLKKIFGNVFCDIHFIANFLN